MPLILTLDQKYKFCHRCVHFAVIIASEMYYFQSLYFMPKMYQVIAALFSLPPFTLPFGSFANEPTRP